MPYPRLSSLVRSLRFKLTVLNSVVVLLASVASLLAMREGLRYALEQETDQILREETVEIALAIEELYPNRDEIFHLLERKAAVHLEHGWFLEVFGPEGSSLWKSTNLPAEVAGKSAEELRAFSLLAAGPYRVAERGAQPALGPVFSVRVGTSTEFIRRDVEKLTRLMIPVGLVFVILSPLGGFLLAGRATAPFQEIIATAERLRPSHMEERLPIRGTGDELDQLSIKINRLLDQIASYLGRHREFVSDAAHELRSPLAALQSSIEVALGKTRSSEEYEELLLDVSAECQQLSALVNQLLLLAETESGVEANREPVNLAEVVRRSCDMFEAVADERGVRLQMQLHSPAIVPGDQGRLRQVVNNLLDNALKFTPEGGSIIVSVQVPADVGTVVLSVADSGIGIPPDEIEQIFDRFYQIDKSRQRVDSKRGSGLGLSICQSIVGSHGGKIEVESTPGRGTTFSVVLPAGK